MSTVLDEVLKANAGYSESFGNKTNLALPPARRFAILTCMDARLDPAKYAGLSEGDAHVIRNAGGRASDDAIRSLVISYKLLGTREWFVIHHTNCGMEFFTDEVIRDLLANSLETAELGENGFRDVGKGPGSQEGRFIDWLTIKDAKQAVIDDVTRIRRHPLVPKTIPIYGYIYDVKTGKLVEIQEATRVGHVEDSTGAVRRAEVEVPVQERFVAPTSGRLP
jgi:carbonic anhydrase